MTDDTSYATDETSKELASNPKCSIKNGNEVVPCDSLRAVTEYGNPRGKQKGIWAWRYVKTDTPISEVSRLFFGTKSGEHVIDGFAFDFCPFCGSEISEPHGAD